MGIIYLKKKEIDKAEVEFQKVLTVTPNEPAALKEMAHVFLVRGDVDRAESLLQKVVSANYVDDEIYYLLGALTEQKGNLEEAVRYYKKNCERLLEKGCLR